MKISGRSNREMTPRTDHIATTKQSGDKTCCEGSSFLISGYENRGKSTFNTVSLVGCRATPTKGRPAPKKVLDRRCRNVKMWDSVAS